MTSFPYNTQRLPFLLPLRVNILLRSIPFYAPGSRNHTVTDVAGLSFKHSLQEGKAILEGGSH